jgi:ABC-2 type transport system permease protein
MVFATIAALAAQLTQSGGSARGLAVGSLGVAFTLRAAADAGNAATLGWLSPIGWFTRLRPFAGEKWSVLGLSLATCVFFGWAGYWLSSRRDVGAGVFAPRVGPATAGARLASPLGLAWRLQRTALVGWSIGLVGVAAVYGSVADSVDDMINDSPQLAAILEATGGIETITDTFFSFATGILALIVTAYSIRTALKLRAEEEAARAEAVLATSTRRTRWMASHLVVAGLGPILMLTLVGLVMGAVYANAIGDNSQIARVFGIAMIQLPAVWVLTGATAALFGLWPRMTSVSWGLLITCLIFGQLGQILRFPQWMLDLSPFTHVAAISIRDIDVVPVVVLVAVAAGLLGSGFVGFNRRDVTSS